MKINSRILLFPKNKINLTYKIIACVTVLNLILENSFNYLKYRYSYFLQSIILKQTDIFIIQNLNMFIDLYINASVFSPNKSSWDSCFLLFRQSVKQLNKNAFKAIIINLINIYNKFFEVSIIYNNKCNFIFYHHYILLLYNPWKMYKAL